MKSFNGRFDIRDQYGGNKPNCSVYSLKLTDKAFTELQEAIKHGHLQIKFKNKTEGKIRFDVTKPWEQAGKAFSETALAKDTVVLDHKQGDDFVSNYGEITKSFKINPNVRDSFENTKKSMREIQKSNENSATKVLENKGSRYDPKYIRKRNAMESQRLKHDLSANATSPDSTSHQSRTPTPPPTLVVEKQYGSVETRVIHILAINNNKLTTEKLKEMLHQRKLMAGPEMSKISGILDKIAVQKNNKRWSLKKEVLEKNQVRKDWAGYFSKERQVVVDFLSLVEKEGASQKRKTLDPGDSDSRSTTPNVDETQKHTKRPRLMPTQNAKNNTGRIAKSELEPNSRDSDHSSHTHFKPVESPASMSSNGSHNSPNLSEASQLSPNSPKQRTPNHVSPVSKPIPPRSAIMERYKHIQENTQKRERARKMSNEEVNENAIRNRLTAEDEEVLKTELEREYPKITTSETELAYKQQCHMDFKRVNDLQPLMEAADARFDKYERDIRRLQPGTREYKELYRRIVDDYRRECDKGILKYQREYRECSHRYTHIKRRLTEYYEVKIS